MNLNAAHVRYGGTNSVSDRVGNFVASLHREIAVDGDGDLHLNVVTGPSRPHFVGAVNALHR